jgi:hypothetical protein
LLDGQHSRTTMLALKWFRDAAAHPHMPSIRPPGDSARAIRDLAEIVNHLWGQDTPGGRLYPAPLEMAAFYVYWSLDGHQRATSVADSLVRDTDKPGWWFLVEAEVNEDLMCWHPDFELTMYPATLLWAGTSRESALEAWQAHRTVTPRTLTSRWRDRTFLVRYKDKQLEPPRSPEQFRRLAASARDIADWRWLILRADYPGDIGYYVQCGAHTGAPLFGRVEQYAVENVDDVQTWDETEARLAKLGL